MFDKTQMKIMLNLQNKINTKVNQNWITADNDWMLAAMMESAEAIDHHGWKWWKKQESDTAQLQMELVDIWHFILSKVITEDSSSLTIQNYDFVFDNKIYCPENNSLVENLKLMTGLASVGRYEISLFYKVMQQANLPFDDLFKQYVGKNVLNIFRQDNGYKDGSYTKIWFDGREDNEHLVEILNVANIHSTKADEEIYNRLQFAYLKNKN